MTTRIKWLSVLLVVAISWSPVWAYSFTPQYAQAAPEFGAQDLNEMLAPIALYPDPLLAQFLPAATFVDQIQGAEHLLHGHVNEGLIDNQYWDVSVKAIAHYPDILKMMAENPEWTAALGQAYVTQEAAVAHSIQYLRQQALNSGALQSTPQLSVIVNEGYIRIVPGQAQVIYVPRYNPSAIWGFPDIIYTPAPSYGLIGFGTGLLIGSWLNRDWDWSGRGPYYHGWHGGGWVGASRNHVNINHNYYVNNRFTTINVNRNVDRQDTRNFRERVRREATTRTKPAPTPPAPAPPGEVNKGKPTPPEAAPPREKPAPAPRPPAEVEKAPPAAPTPAPAPEAKPAPKPPSEVPKAPPAPTTEPRPKPAPAPRPAPEVRPTPPAPPAAPAPPEAPRAKPAPTTRPAPEVRQAPPAPTTAPAAPQAPRAKPAPTPRPAPEVRQAPPAPTAPAPPQAPRGRPTPSQRPAPEVRQSRPAPTAPAPPQAPRAKPTPAPAPAPQARPAPAPQPPAAKPEPPKEEKK